MPVLEVKKYGFYSAFKGLLLIFLVLGSFRLQAQATGEEELGNWFMYFGTSKLSERYSLHTEAQLRLFEPVSNFNQLLLRVGVNYHISPQASLTAGYGYIPTASFISDPAESKVKSIEHRIWEQFILKNRVGKVFFEHRYRLEQRWVAADAGDRYLNRARYRIMLNIPLNNAEMSSQTLFLSLYDEVFLHLTDSPFDQNRLYAALGYKFNDALSVQSGYLRHRLGDNSFNRLQFALFINTDFTE